MNTKKIYGITLIELMIAIAIVSILTLIAYPSYQSYMLKARRVDAKNALLDLTSRQQRYYSINNKYSTTANDLGYDALPADISSSGGSISYKLSIVSHDDGKAWTATATPQGKQSKDSCGSFSITDKGVQSFSGANGKKDQCW